MTLFRPDGLQQQGAEMPPRPVKLQQNRSSQKTEGCVLSSAIDVADLDDDNIKMNIYGENRVGKTTLACKFPGPVLLISFEPNKTGGAKSVTKMPGVKYLRVTSTKAAMQLAEELRSDRFYKTHVLDGATSLQDIVLRELLDLPAIPEMLTWGL